MLSELSSPGRGICGLVTGITALGADLDTAELAGRFTSSLEDLEALPQGGGGGGFTSGLAFGTLKHISYFR